MKSKPIALFLTDTHLKDGNEDLVYDIFKQAIKLCKKMGIKRIIHGGDFFTSRTSQTLAVLIRFYAIRYEIGKAGIELIGIPGNHDKTNQDVESSYLDIFKNKTFKVIAKQTCLEIDGITIGFMPFFTDSFNERLKELTDAAIELNNDHNILITHAAFNGAVNNDGSVVSEGVKVKSVKFWDKVLVGHYHDSNQFKNIYYTGSAYQGNYGERIDDKGFTIIYDDGEIDFEPSKFPKYIKVKLDINDDIDTEIEMHASETDNVRFIFSGDKTDIHKIDRQKLNDFGIDVKLELNDVNEEMLRVETDDFSSMSMKNILTYFKEYCEIQDIDKKKMSAGIKHLIV